MNETKRLIRKIGFVFCSVLIVVLLGSAANGEPPRDPGASSQQKGTTTPAPAPVEQSYPVSSGHWVDLVMEQGTKVKLEDGSVWEIATKDQYHTRDWRVAQKISVSRNPNDRYPFKLANTDQKVSADARLAVRSR